jgi:L-malate glycosyltransferase
VSSVAIVQRVLPAYRAPLFDQLHAALSRVGIDLRLFYGQEQTGTVPRTVALDRPWAVKIKNRYMEALVWQPCFRDAMSSDLVVLEHANRYLLNYALLSASRLRGKPRVALWGHGRNMQSEDSGLRERWKRILARSADWYFAYNDLSKTIAIDAGVPPDHITVVNNTIDVRALAQALDAVSATELEQLSDQLGIPRGASVGLYCGAMYRGKALEFLVRAAEVIERRVPGFHLILLGDGPERDLVAAAAQRHSWIRWVGEIVGRERAPFYRLARVMLVPAQVGLVIVDSFVAGVPLITTNVPTHGPEIAYLRADENGVMTDANIAAYADAVAEVLTNRALHQSLRNGCEQAARQYALENTVEALVGGIGACLAK